MRKLQSQLSAHVRRQALGAAIALWLPVAGLASTSSPGPDAATPAVGAIEQRAASKQGVVMLEGEAEPTTLVLFEWAPAALPLGFSTFAPQDLVVKETGAGVAPTVRFIANFGGVLQEQAYLEFAWLPAGITQAQAVHALRRSVSGGAPLKTRADANRQFGWSLAECDISYRSKRQGRVGGVAALGRHGDRYYRFTVHYPLEYGGGFVPRADVVLQEWRWRDTQTGL